MSLTNPTEVIQEEISDGDKAAWNGGESSVWGPHFALLENNLALELHPKQKFWGKAAGSCSDKQWRNLKALA